MNTKKHRDDYINHRDLQENLAIAFSLLAGLVLVWAVADYFVDVPLRPYMTPKVAAASAFVLGVSTALWRYFRKHRINRMTGEWETKHRERPSEGRPRPHVVASPGSSRPQRNERTPKTMVIESIVPMPPQTPVREKDYVVFDATTEQPPKAG